MRIVMLTDDVQIDRRIVQEAQSLITQGHEVILLAGWQEGLPEFERIGQVKVERLRHPQFPVRLRLIYALQGRVIWSLNWVSRGGQWLIGRLSLAWQKLITLCAQGVNLLTRLFAQVVLGRGLPPHELAVYERVRRYRPEVIHAHDLPQLRPGAKAKRCLHVPLVYDAHELYPDQPRLTARQRRYLRRLEARYIGTADRVITVNSLLAQELTQRYQHPAVSVVQNAIDPPAAFDPTQHYDRFRQEYGLALGQILVLYQGFIAPERNLEVLVAGMKFVAERRFVLLIMGYGEYVQQLRLLAQREAVTDRVVFVPSQTQAELLYYTASADIGVIPYPYGRDSNTHYVSPNKLYEFIVAGVPILTNNLPYVRGVVETYGFGVWADMQTAEGFAAALTQFPVEKLAEYRRNLQQYQHQFWWEVEAEKLLALYQDLVPPSALRR
jgi:glycosyltransferase involved in cell wall biosynthesis